MFPPRRQASPCGPPAGDPVQPGHSPDTAHARIPGRHSRNITVNGQYPGAWEPGVAASFPVLAASFPVLAASFPVLAASRVKWCL
jgi:hypothetical protein